MKTFRLIGMALLAVVMSFASCSSDDDEGNGGNGGNNQKKLVRMVEKYSGHEENIIDFSYDNNGRLVSINENNYAITTISWDGNTVTTKESAGGTTHTANFTLSNNLVTKWIDRWDYQSGDPHVHDYSFSYNSSNQLTELLSDGNTICTLERKNGKVSQFTYYYEYDESVYEYTYYDNINYKGYAPVLRHDEIWNLFENDKIFYAHPELVGCRGLGLPKNIVNTDTGEIISIAYEFYEDGYVKTRTMTFSDDYDSYTFTYIWE